MEDAQGREGPELYVARLKPGLLRYSKDLSLNEIEHFLDVIPYKGSLDDYIEPCLLYFTENLSSLAAELNLDRICPKGLYVMGIYGGEKKKDKERYAGLALEAYRQDGARFEFRLYGTEETLAVPVNRLAAYGVNVYKVVYEGEINPFKLRRYIDVLLSQRGEKHLKMFFKDAIMLNSRSISSSTARMVAKLLDELKQPSGVAPLSTSKHYVVYRCDRAFTALALKPPDDNLIVESHVAYAECSSEDAAHYYAAVLNYLAFKVLESGRSFIRHQFARPLFAAYIAGLAWREIDDEARSKVVELSKRLHEKAPDKKYGNQQVALKEIASYPEFKVLKSILDSKIDEEKLEAALDMVSGRSVEDESA